jgi:hypothetical protein
MTVKTVIIAHRRRGQDYWEGYNEQSEADSNSLIAYYRSIGQIVKVFPSMTEYRADCNGRLDKKDATRQNRRNPV